MPVPAPARKAESPPLVESVAHLRRCVAAARAAGRKITLVPTMGAIHAGHRSLIDAAAAAGAYTVVSIYVNPTQFGPNEDYQQYPRNLEADRQACRDGGVDLIFTPDNAEMYPPGEQTRVKPGSLADGLCGRFRPGHFEGVCTVVAKLFNIVQPDKAYFGQKDAQQALIIQRMVADLAIPVEIVVCPTVREPDGLAMSSRNAYLSAEQRRRAICLYASLCAGRDLVLNLQERGEAAYARALRGMRRVLKEAAGTVGEPLTVDYLEIVNAETLAPAAADTERLLLAGAIRVGSTRLIDNLVVDLRREGE